MTANGHRLGLLRHKTAGGHHRVTFVELFFDLVFVFAVTQISHSLAGHYTPSGALQTLFLMLAMWWVWVYTSWATNWLEPEHVSVRLLLFAMMFAGLVMSSSIPTAFEGGGLAFGLAFSFMQVARGAFIAWAIPAEHGALKVNFIRIMLWLMASAVFWIAGGLTEGPLRVALWIVALGIEIMGPWARFWTPGLGASSVHDWNVDGAHMAERCALFVIIALGESILVTGVNFSKVSPTPVVIAAFVVGFIGSVAMWWIYFDQGAEAGSREISRSDNPGRLARLAYTYMHLPIIGGIVLSAVADELLLAHPQLGCDVRDGTQHPRRSGAVPRGRGVVQMVHPGLVSALTSGRTGGICRDCAVLRSDVATGARCPGGGDSGRSGGLGKNVPRIGLSRVNGGAVLRSRRPWNWPHIR